MEFSRGVSIPPLQEGESFKFSSTWIPAIPGKPVPVRPQMSTVTQGESSNQQLGRLNWFQAMGFPPTDVIHRAPMSPNAARAEVAVSQPFLPSVDQPKEFNNWESALMANRLSEPMMNTYTQAINNSNNSNQLNQWNNLNFTQLLAFADDKASGFPTTSATLTTAIPAASSNGKGKGKAVAGNIMPGRPYFPFSLYADGSNQLQSTQLLARQNYMTNSNQSSINSNQEQLMAQNGFPVPCASTYGHSSNYRTMYDLNCPPGTMGNTASNSNLSLQYAPVTPEKGGQIQNHPPPDAVQNGNMLFQFTTGGPDKGGRDKGSRLLQNRPDAAGPSNNASYQLAAAAENGESNGSKSTQFAPVTPDKGFVAQNSHISEMVNQGRNKGKEVVNPCIDNLQIPSSQGSCLESVVNSVLEKPSQVGTSSVDLLAPTKENNQPEKGGNGIDLNKTPQPKPKRKKHRPRVVIEGKPKRTPKSTVKQGSTNETPERKKRKYVRRNVASTSKTPSKDVPGEIHNGATETPSTDVISKNNDSNQHAAIRACKRSLNFDSEEQGCGSHSKELRRQDEEHQNMNNNSSYYAFNNITQSQQLDKCTRKNDILGNKRLQLSNDFGLMVQNSLADVALDLNQNATQMLGDYISLPDTPQAARREVTRPECTIQPPRKEIIKAELPYQPTRRELLRANLKLLARAGSNKQTAGEGLSSERKYQQDIRQPELINGYVMGNHERFVPSGLQTIHSVSKSQNNMDCSQNLQVAENRQEIGSKRTYSQAMDQRSTRSYNLIGPHINFLKTYYEMFGGTEELRNKSMLFPEIHKKRRTEKSQNTKTASIPNATAMGDRPKPTIQQNYDATPKLSPAQRNQDHHCDANGSESLRNRAPVPPHGYYSLPSTSGQTSLMQEIASAGIESQRPVDKQKSSELMLTIRQTEMKTGKRSKAHTRVRDLATLTSVTQCNNLQSPLPRNAPTSCDRRVVETFQEVQNSVQPTQNHKNIQSKKYSRKSPQLLSSTNGPAALSGYHNHHSSISRGSLETMQQFNSPIDHLIQRLNCLTISGESISCERNMVSARQQNALVPFGDQNVLVPFGDQNALVPFSEQKALVPFKADVQMVPYGGTFDLTKKKRPRPKVDLDQETNRVWNLLMGKESESDEGITPDKEKWWAEERRVFRSRADLFIAKMHQIQGDRRFNKWNGSVLDSVIGVFLTQNVSDHLSSSAFMSLAARFPLKRTNNDKKFNEEGPKMYVEEPEMDILVSENTKWHKNMPHEPVKSQDSQGSVTPRAVDHIEIREIGNGSETSESNTGGRCSSGILERECDMCQAAPMTKAGTINSRTGCANFVEAEDGRIVEVESSGISPQISVGSSLFEVNVGRTIVSNGGATLLETGRGASEDIISPENAANLFINTKDEIIRSYSESSSSENLAARSKPDGLNGSTSFMELLCTTVFQEYCNPGNEGLSIDLNSDVCCEQLETRDAERKWNLDMMNSERNYIPVLPLNNDSQHLETPIISSSGCSLQVSPNTGAPNVQCPQMIGAQSSSSLTSTAAIREQKIATNMVGVVPMKGTTREITKQKVALDVGATAVGAPNSSLNKQSVHQEISIEQEVHCNRHLNSRENIQIKVSRNCLEGDQSTESEILGVLGQRRNNNIQQAGSNSPFFSGETLDVVESTLVHAKKDCTEHTDAESMTKEQACSSQLTQEMSTKNPKSNSKDKKKAVGWDYLRKDAYQKCGRRERTPDTMDSLDWEAVRCADVSEIAKAIKERGMNNMLAERIKDFLNRLVAEHEDIDLEWLRDVPPDKAKEYLLSVRGLGLKSVECVRLLTLHHLAFPVDTNVGRIAVRLGWVPLQPLPESLQLHLLEMYPILESIQKYLWPRLCTLDQRTLYELHYQLITFGKVFCTKSRPNCNACPMRADCKHFASAYTSARFGLTWHEEKGIVSSTDPTLGNQFPNVGASPLAVLPPEANLSSESICRASSSNEPIIEVPASPEPESPRTDLEDIEDFFDEDPDDPDNIPTIKLNAESLALNIQNYLQEKNLQISDGDVSNALVVLNPETASIPTQPLKNVSRLRTEHQVYELPDSHPLLKGMEKRVPGDVCTYLLAIWTPGETAESTQPPARCCASQTSEKLCDDTTCFSCNSIREAQSQTVRGTLLIPCRTAMRGSFPLNGTYFQVNEVFADHDSSVKPIEVPRAWIWNLPRRTVYFGTSIPSIFKGQTTKEIQNCFWKGYVCVRGFDQKTRAPRPLLARLHFPASKLAEKLKQKKTSK